MRKIQTRPSTIVAQFDQIETEIDGVENSSEADRAERLSELRAKIRELRAQVEQLTRTYPDNLADIVRTNLARQNDDKLAFAKAQVNYAPNLLMHEYDQDTALSVARVLVDIFKPKGFKTEGWEALLPDMRA